MRKQVGTGGKKYQVQRAITDISKNKRTGVQDGGESCDVVWLETVALRKRKEAELEVAEVLFGGVTRMDEIRNEYIRGTVRFSKRPD